MPRRWRSTAEALRILADECCDAGVVAALRAWNADVLYAAEMMPRAADAEVLARAAVERRILVTADTDFGELLIRRGEPACGAVLLRMEAALTTEKVARMRVLITNHAARLHGHLTIVTARAFRFRPLPRR